MSWLSSCAHNLQIHAHTAIRCLGSIGTHIGILLARLPTVIARFGAISHARLYSANRLASVKRGLSAHLASRLRQDGCLLCPRLMPIQAVLESSEHRLDRNVPRIASTNIGTITLASCAKGSGDVRLKLLVPPRRGRWSRAFLSREFNRKFLLAGK